MASRLKFGVVVFAIVFLTAAEVAGQSLYWDVNGNATAGTGASPTGTWSTGTGSWNTNSAGTGGAIVSWTNWSDAVFSAGTNGTGAYTVTVSGTVGISSLTIEEGSPVFTGGTIQFSGTPNFSVATGLTATINSVVDDQYYGGINKTGSGTLVLGGSNTFQAPVTVSAGTLTLANSSALGATGTWGNSVASGATLALQGGITVAEGSVGLSGTGSGGSGALRNVSGNNTLSGSVTFDNDATITSDSGTLTLSGDFSAGKNVTFAGAGNIALTGGGYGGGSLTQTGTGTLTFSGSTSTSLSGTLNIDSGTVAFAKTGGATAVASATINVGNGVGSAGSAVLQLGASNQISDGTNVAVKADGNFNLNGYSEGLKSLTTLAGSQVTVGSTGAFTIGTNGGGTSSLAGTITVGGGSLSFTGGNNTVTGTGSLNLGGGSLAVTNGTNTFAGTVSLGGGTALVSAGTNAFTGTTNLDGGTLTFSAGTNTVNGTVNLDGGSLLFSGGTNSLGGTVAGGGTVTLSGGSLALQSSLVLAGELQLNAGTLLLSGYNLTVATLHITGNSTIDFAGGNSSLSATNLLVDAGVTLSIINWANATDYFFAQNWSGASFGTSGATPMNQVSFAGFTSPNTTIWQAYDYQVTPVPEPATYGAAFLGLGLGCFLLRRYCLALG